MINQDETIAPREAPFAGVPSVEEVVQAASDASGRAARGTTKSDALSVSAAVRKAKGVLSQYPMRIVGEVSELSNKPGYRAVYFTIKDEEAVLPCLMWKNRFQAAGVTLSLGAKVEVTGKFSIYAPKGRMNFEVSKLVFAGDGDLRAKVARLAEKLRAEGLMEASRKRPIPFAPQTIGVVTSPRGAAVHDVLRTLRRRWPLARIVFAGIPVEGQDAPRNMIAALDAVAHAGAEVVLLVRGGGSFEDLMPFNDESLARAVALMPIPVVTGIGHEPDTSIADMVSDLRASTPTAAAEAVSPQEGELTEALNALCARMTRSLSGRLTRSVTYVEAIASRPLFKDPESLFATDAQSLDVAQTRLEQAGSHLTGASAAGLEVIAKRLEVSLPHTLAMMRASLVRAGDLFSSRGSRMTEACSHEVARAEESLSRLGTTLLSTPLSEAALITSRLNDLSPLHTLERGWSITTNEAGAVVRSVHEVCPHESLKVQLYDGVLSCHVDEEPISEVTALISWEEDDG